MYGQDHGRTTSSSSRLLAVQREGLHMRLDGVYRQNPDQFFTGHGSGQGCAAFRAAGWPSQLAALPCFASQFGWEGNT